MSGTIITVSLTVALNAFGLGQPPSLDQYPHQHHHHQQQFSYIMPPGPGLGWGFQNGNPDGYGWVDYGVYLPLGADRTAEYFFPRFLSAPPGQLFPGTFFDPFETRGQRYIPYCGAGGEHPMGGPPTGSSHLPVSPYAADRSNQPVVRVPRLNGRIESPPLPSGGSGLNP
jgi:hypothetical protein